MLFEAFILYISVCMGPQCNWTYGGTFHPSQATIIDYPEGRKRIRQESTPEEMCQKAAKRLKLEDGKWQCLSGGFNVR